MRRFVFPFDKVNEGSKIIIYGVGNVGVQYISQIEGRYDLLFAVDSDAALLCKKLPNVSVCYPRQIDALSAEEYDYIIIAIVNKEDAEYIKNTIINKGVPEDKIIYDIRWYDDIKTLNSPEVRSYTQCSFSWFGEDLIVKGIFDMLGIEKPTYLDIGCNHPYIGNNTAFLYLTGSRGINIDANQIFVNYMKEERPEDTNLCIGVLTEEGENDFFIVDEMSGLNSFSKDNISRHNQVQGLKDSELASIKVQCYTLKTVIDKYCNGVFPDYFDLDIEGMDEAVMASYDFSVNGPKVICVESHDQEVNRQMKEQGYVRYFVTKHNSIYMQKELFDKIVLQ